MELPSPTSQLGFDISDVFQYMQLHKRQSNSLEEIDFHVAEFSQLSEVNLNDFMNTGVDVILDEKQFSGQVVFKTKPHNL